MTFVAICSVVIALGLLIQFPRVQTYVASHVTKTLSENLNGEVSVEKIHFKPFTTLVLKNTLIIDKDPVQDPTDSTATLVDTFFRAEYIIAQFTLEGLFKSENIKLKRVFVDNAEMALVLETPDPEKGRPQKDNLSRIFRLKKPEAPKKSEKDIFSINNVEVRNMRFIMKCYEEEKIKYAEGGINWNDMDIRDIDLKASDLGFKAGIMSGKVNQISFWEKSGYKVLNMSGEARVGRGKTIITDIRLKDPWSDVFLNEYRMTYDNIHAFKDYIDLVKMDGEVASSRLSMKTISYFAPNMQDNGLVFNVTGKMSGVVRDFSIENIKVDTKEGFSGTVNGRITGIPEVEDMKIDARMSDFRITTKGLGKFISGWSRGKELDLSKFSPGTTYSFSGTAKGSLNRLRVYPFLYSDGGSLKGEILLENLIDTRKDISIGGHIKTDDLNIGTILNTELVKEVSVESGLSANLGKEGITARIDSLNIGRLHLNGYDYQQIAAAGKYDKDSFNATVISNDPNLNFLIQASGARSEITDNHLYKIYANLGYADLNAMNVDKRGTSKARLQASANFTRTENNQTLGKIDLANIILENGSGKYDIGNINISSHTADSLWEAKIRSRFLDGSYKGTAPVKEFIEDVKNITLKKETPALFKDSTYTWNDNSYNVDLRFHNSMDVFAFALPGFYIADSTSVVANVNKDGSFEVGLKSQRIAYKEQYVKGIEAAADNKENDLELSFNANEIKVASLKMLDNKFQIYTDNNHLGFGFTYDNHGEYENRGEIYARSGFSRDEGGLGIDVEILPSKIYLNSREWSILPAEISMKGDSLTVNSARFTSGEQLLTISGTSSRSKRDTLTLDMERFDISVINALVNKNLGISGAASGFLRVTSPSEDRNILVDIVCDSTHLANKPLGVVMARCDWNDEDNNFDISLENRHRGTNTIRLGGQLSPKDKEMDIVADLDSLDLGYVIPFTEGIFNEMDGNISGRFGFKGNFDNLELSSENARLDDAVLRIEYTNVPYVANGNFHLDSYGVYFDDISIKDNIGGVGVVSGSIRHDHFKDFNFDTRIRVEDILAVNLREEDADVFYGRLFGTGNIALTGPMNSLLLTVDALTSKAGNLHIPVMNFSSANKSNLLKFKEKEVVKYIDPYETMINKLKIEEKKDATFDVKIRVNASQDVEAYVEIDKASGNVLSGHGNGIIDLDIRKDAFSINGDYTLTGGNYKFVAMGLASRDFRIQDGSSIRFNGDIMESTLDIDAIYNTKASLSTLISDTTSISSRHPVECGINITDKISNPRVSFSIDIPDIDPMIKSRVESALSTEDKVQKQFLSLIISNNFLPDEQSGIVNNSSVLYSNVSEIMANQINNIFQKLDIPLDLGLNYQPTETGTDIFDVALSTQLFNNRVVVNGNIGNRQYSTGTTQNEVVGDIDIEIKLDRTGALRLTLFSHSADQYSNYLDNSQRNGVGITFQQEFNSLGKFIKYMFSSKKKRQAAKRADELAIIEGGKKEIIIEAEPDIFETKKEKRNGRRKRKTISDTVSAGGE